MKKKELANINIRIVSAEHATWQGEAEADGERFLFQSEMQLFRWLCRKYPELLPDTPHM